MSYLSLIERNEKENFMNIFLAQKNNHPELKVKNPVITTINAVKWLEYYLMMGRISLLRDKQTYLLSRDLGEKFIITLNPEGRWVLASYNLPALFWFPNIKWEKECLLNETFLILTSKPVKMPEIMGEPLKNSTIPSFSMALQMHYLIAKEVIKEKILGIGKCNIKGGKTPHKKIAEIVTTQNLKIQPYIK